MTIAVSGVVPEELALNCTISNFMKMQSDLVRFGIFLKNSKTRHCQTKMHEFNTNKSVCILNCFGKMVLV